MHQWLSALGVMVLVSLGCGSGGGGPGGHGGTSAAGTGGRGGGAGTTGAGGNAAGSVGTGGSAGAGIGGTTGAGGRGGAAGSASGGTGGVSSQGGLLDMFDDSAGMTIAVDSTGAIHVAAATIVQGTTYNVAYARCPGQCNVPQSWTGVALPLESDTSHVPTIALTASGRPRILYASDLGAAPGFHYLECDSACDEAASWHDVSLTMGDPGSSPLPRPSVPFAVSPEGAAAFAYDDGFGMYAQYCRSNCALGTSWTRVTLADVFIYAESIAFGGDTSLQVVARHA
ncbi:MAG TPA: hypothetical protein VN903_10510, partial [Polyangia bacterium]|nr:hypothetical protein [Polyangia bacterium]